MNRYLFVAEKPSVMKTVQTVYLKHKSEIDAAVNGTIFFSALVGHVGRWAWPKEYQEWSGKWNEIPLPIIPEEWKIKVNPSTRDVFNRIIETYNKQKCNAVIVGTDSDIEGNGIFYFLERLAGWEKIKALRFFEQTMTEEDIRNSFLHLTDFRTYPRDVNMTKSRLVRSQSDWKYGMNLTVRASIMAGATLRIGRVKAPTLKMVYDNCKAIDEFKPKTSYCVQADFANGMSGIYVNPDDKKDILFDDIQSAKSFIQSLHYDKGTVKSVDKKQVKTNPPHLFKLSDLQGEAGPAFGYGPDDVLKILQSLYENHKLISYPRTDGRFISTSKAKELPRILQAISNVDELKPYIDKIPSEEIAGISRKTAYVNDEEVKKASHDALLPTTTKPDLKKLTVEERNIYLMVCKRLISIFYPPLIEEKTVVITDVGGALFKSTGTMVADKGWTLVVPKKKNGTELPYLRKGDLLDVRRIAPKERTTTPPKRLTTSALILMMENIANYLQEKEYKSIMKEASGIGTPSSRAAIINDLITSGYMTTKKNSIYITDVGKQYIENLEGIDIINPELTAELELLLKKIRQGEESPELVMKKMDDSMFHMMDQMQNIKQIKREAKLFPYKCPTCGSSMRDSEKGIFCTNESCGLAIWKKIAGKTLPQTALKELCTKGITGTIKGFKSKNGNSFDARIKIEGNKLAYNFDSELICPACGKPLHKMDWGYGCTGYRDGCSFAISNTFGGKIFTDSEIKKLLSGKTIGPFEGLVSSKGKSFNASLHLELVEGKYKIIPKFK